MYRKICIVCFLFITASSTFGQKVKFGVLIDPTITWLRSDVSDVTRDKARLGIDIGMSIDYFFAENYAFVTGISMFNMGGTLKYDKGITIRTKEGNTPIDAGGKVKYNVQYVKIPLALKFKTQEIGRITYSANLGVDPMVRVSTNVDFKDSKNVKANKETNLFNLGWHFGLGAQYSLGEETAIFGGFSFMNTFMDLTKPSHDNITSNNVMLRIGVLF